MNNKTASQSRPISAKQDSEKFCPAQSPAAAGFRTESDSIGEKLIPSEAYYGVQTLRAKENFNISGRKLSPEFINSLVLIKKACAAVNSRAGVLPESIAEAIIAACDEILDGRLRDQFIVDPLQGGAGTSMNMNANEVIANRACELAGFSKGDYSRIHPNDSVNLGQSTNDVIPSAGKITAWFLTEKLEKALRALYIALLDKATEFMNVLKMGRTQMQDAVPITLGQEFMSYASAVERSLERINTDKKELLGLNMGGTAIGTGLNANPDYFINIVPEIAKLTGRDFYRLDDLIDGTQNADAFSSVSSTVKQAALTLSKIANDLRLMSSGPKTGFAEIILPAKQNGSSIMPGKINPVIPEIMNQACFRVFGNDLTIAMAAEAGQLELNAFEPVIFDALFDSFTVLTNAIITFTDNCVRGIKANEENCLRHLNSSVGIVTALCPQLGYAECARLAKKALATGTGVRELVLSEDLMDEKTLSELLDARSMTGVHF